MSVLWKMFLAHSCVGCFCLVYTNNREIWWLFNTKTGSVVVLGMLSNPFLPTRLNPTHADRVSFSVNVFVEGTVEWNYLNLFHRLNLFKGQISCIQKLKEVVSRDCWPVLSCPELTQMGEFWITDLSYGFIYVTVRKYSKLLHKFHRQYNSYTHTL